MIPCKICVSHENKNQVLKDFEFWCLREAPEEKNCKGYLYVECKRHVESYHELSNEEWNELSKAIQYGYEWINKNFHPEKIYFVSIAEKVPHLHIHLIPRYANDSKGLEHIASVL